MVTAPLREEFDRWLDREVAALPPAVAALLAEVPLIVDDEASPELLAELGMEPDDELCGLHDGIAMTEQSVEHDAVLPTQMRLFRGPILRMAGCDRGRPTPGQRRELRRQIHITLLHEIGHHFGLDEQQLEELGYA